jgi:hypothetical protein
LGLAKECATWVLTGGIGLNPSPTRCVSLNGGTANSIYGGCWGPAYGPVKGGLHCLDKTNAGGMGVVIEVSQTGELTCTINGRTS